MAFDFGAALTAAGQIAPAWQQAKLDQAEEARRQLASKLQERKAQSDIAYQQALTQRQELERQRGIPFRTYVKPDGSEWEDILTSSGIKSYEKTPSPGDSFRTIESLLKDEGITLTPEQKTSTLLQSYGIKQPVGNFKPLTGEGGKPFQGADKQWYINGTNPEGQIVAQPLGSNYQPPPPKFNADQQYRSIIQKKLSGETLTKDEQTSLDAYDYWNNKRNVLPGIERAKAYAQFGRYVPVVGEDGKVYPMNIEEAERTQAPMTQSIPFQVAKGLQTGLARYFTIGKGGQNIVALNTASGHLDMLSGMVDALGNGNVQLLNSLGQRWAKATGDPAPTNFESLRNSLVGEMARVFTGVGATQEEIANITGPLSLADSPQQLKGAIQTARLTMQSRVDALLKQYQDAQQGKPAFNTSPANDNPLGLALPGGPQ